MQKTSALLLAQRSGSVTRGKFLRDEFVAGIAVCVFVRCAKCLWVPITTNTDHLIVHKGTVCSNMYFATGYVGFTASTLHLLH